MIRDMEIAFWNQPVINAHSYSDGKAFHRLIIEIDNLTIRLDRDDAKRLRDAIDAQLRGAQEAA